MFRFFVRAVLCLGLAALVSACAQPARTGAMVVNVTDATVISPGNPLKTAVALNSVAGGEETSPLWTSEVSDTDFRKALELTLKQHTILGDQNAPLKLRATLLNLDQPIGGFSMTVNSSVRYEIKAAAGETVFDETVSVSGTATFSDTGLGVERLRIANERAMKNNIQGFVRKLVDQSRKDPASFGGTATSALVLSLG